MKTLLNVLRSIITSFLFIILIILIVIQFLFTTIRLQNTKLSNLINRENIYDLVITDVNLRDNQNVHEIGIQYIDDYINYVFYKRSFPTIDLSDIETATEQEYRLINEGVELLKAKVDLQYETILQIRDFNNFISNGSIYLLINIAVFTLTLVIGIVTGSLSKSFKFFASSLVIGALISLIGEVIISSNFLNNSNPIIVKFAENIFNNEMNTKFFNLSLIYICLGVALFFTIYILQKLSKK